MIPDAAEAGVYAMAGASAILAGITHTISPCVVIIEITAQANNMLPLLVCTVVSYAVSGEAGVGDCGGCGGDDVFP